MCIVFVLIFYAPLSTFSVMLGNKDVPKSNVDDMDPRQNLSICLPILFFANLALPSNVVC